MKIKVRIPTPLQKLTQGRAEVLAEGGTVEEVMTYLEKDFPGFRDRVYDAQGNLRRFVNFYINEEDIRFLQGVKSPLKENDELSIVPAIAGG